VGGTSFQKLIYILKGGVTCLWLDGLRVTNYDYMKMGDVVEFECKMKVICCSTFAMTLKSRDYIQYYRYSYIVPYLYTKFMALDEFGICSDELRRCSGWSSPVV
jgi:hypothetical protein